MNRRAFFGAFGVVLAAPIAAWATKSETPVGAMRDIHAQCAREFDRKSCGFGHFDAIPMTWVSY